MVRIDAQRIRSEANLIYSLNLALNVYSPSKLKSPNQTSTKLLLLLLPQLPTSVVDPGRVISRSLVYNIKTVDVIMSYV